MCGIRIFGHVGTKMGQAGGCDNGWLCKFNRENVELLRRMQDKVTETDPEQKFVFLDCMIHQEALCKSVLKMNHVVDVVTKKKKLTSSGQEFES